MDLDSLCEEMFNLEDIVPPIVKSPHSTQEIAIPSCPPRLQGSKGFDSAKLKREPITRIRINMLPEWSKSRYTLAEPETFDSEKEEEVVDRIWNWKPNSIIVSFSITFDVDIVEAEFSLSGSSYAIQGEYNIDGRTATCTTPFDKARIVLEDGNSLIVEKKYTKCDYVIVETSGEDIVVDKLLDGYKCDLRVVKSSKTIQDDKMTIIVRRLHNDYIVVFRSNEEVNVEFTSKPYGYILFKGDITMDRRKITLKPKKDGDRVDAAVIVESNDFGVRLRSLSGLYASLQ